MPNTHGSQNKQNNPSNQVEPTPHGSNQITTHIRKRQCSDVDYQSKPLSYRKLNVCFNALLVIATITYVVFACLQWMSMNKEAGIAQRQYSSAIQNFRDDERAWIGVKTIMFSKFTHNGVKVFVKEGQRVRADIEITNTGKTPAINMRQKYGFAFVPPSVIPCECKEFGIEDSGSYGVLQQGITSHLLPQTTEIKYDKIKELRCGQTILYLVGRIQYNDVFTSRVHSTIFCEQLRADLSGFDFCNTCNVVDH